MSQLEIGTMDGATVAGARREFEAAAPRVDQVRTGYRPEIDGLRAFAVVPVILFHAGFSSWSGGYVGVDVFFVISGYLITSILLDEMKGGTFSILRFYERRARRILPALLFVLAVSLFFAWIWMLPSQLLTFAGHMIAVAGFSSNVVLWLSEDYFAPAAEQLPLLHTWSLAVEEQYYLLFPPILLLAWRLGWRRLLWATWAAFGLSFAFSWWASDRYPALDFYLLPSRAWELLAGALCAMVLSRGAVRPSSALSIAGLVLVCLPVVLFDEGTPSPYLLAPVLGAVLIILFAGTGSLGAGILSSRPFVVIGLVSYSAYLWHQPLFAFARLRLPSDPSPPVMLLLCAVALALAYPTWKFVERPMRAGGSAAFASRRRVFAFSAVGLTATLLVGVALIAARGAPFRVPEAVKRIDAARDDINPLLGSCHLGLDAGMTGRAHPIEACLSKAPGGGPPIILTGDSHANALSWELRRAVEKTGRPFYAVTMSSCPPIAGLSKIGGANRMACDGFVRGMRDYAKQSGAEIVVLAARWRFSLDGSKFDNGEGGKEPDDGSRLWDLASGDAAGLEGDALRQTMLAAFVADIRGLLAQGLKVILVYPVPEAGWNVPDRLSRQRMAWREAPDLSTSLPAYRERNRMVIDAFDAIKSPNLYRVRPSEILCDTLIAGRCANSLGDEVLYRDENHVSNAGARRIAPAIVDIIEAVSPMPVKSARP